VIAQDQQVKRLAAAEAKHHIGENATVCGKVASARYAATTRGKPTFFNLDKPYPNQVLTVLTWGENREKFGAPEEIYRDKQICVTGKIVECRNAPEIVVSDPFVSMRSSGSSRLTKRSSSARPTGSCGGRPTPADAIVERGKSSKPVEYLDAHIG
jgi:hypothetical protein